MFTFVLLTSFLSIAQTEGVSVGRIFDGAIGAGWSAQVLRNTIVESGEREYVDERGFTRGGDLRTDVLVLLVEQQNQPFAHQVAWTHTETQRVRGFEVFGMRRAHVEDVKYNNDVIIVLHIAENKNRVSIVGRKEKPETDWRVERTFDLDVSQLATGQEVTGVVGRIVRVNGDSYVHFSHSSLAGQLIYRVERGAVAVERDTDIIGRVNDALRNGD